MLLVIREKLGLRRRSPAGARLRKDVVEFLALPQTEQQSCIDELFRFSSEVFDCKSRRSFERMVSAAALRDVRLLILRDGRGKMCGYNLVRRVEARVNGQSVDLFRAVAAMAPAYRRSSSTLGFGLSTAFAHKLKNPLRATYYVGLLVHPSAYYLFAKHAHEIWPWYGRETPPEKYALLRQLAAACGVEIEDDEQPYVAYDGAPTRETETESEHWRRHPRPEVQLFMRLNPRYSDGYGLVTLIPLTWVNLGIATLRSMVGRLRRRLRGASQRGD